MDLIAISIHSWTNVTMRYTSRDQNDGLPNFFVLWIIINEILGCKVYRLKFLCLSENVCYIYSFLFWLWCFELLTRKWGVGELGIEIYLIFLHCTTQK
jgi:hypothetical protein